MSRTAPFTFYEFFAGGGMARLGLGAGWDCLFANDFDPLKARTYAANFGDDHLRAGDVWALRTSDLPGRADLAWASSPCQDFSLAGARAGLQGGRSSAFFGFWRLMQQLAAEARAPRLIAVENVVGLLNSRRGADFHALCRAFAEIGYRFGAIEIDASTFLPQSRPRIVIVACRDRIDLPAGSASPAIAKARDGLPPDLRALWIDWPTPGQMRANSDLAAILEPDDKVAWRGADKTKSLLALMDDRHRAKIDAAAASGERKIGAVFRRMRCGEQRAEVRFDGLAGCLRTPRGGSSRQLLAIVENGEVRTRLMTAREGARAMGLPDDYKLPAAATGALHVVGDGVAVPVVRWVAAHILEPLLAEAPQRIAAG
ncbi:MAG: DNA cytosine methyltransferase [Caulobacteraceae bacterium]